MHYGEKNGKKEISRQWYQRAKKKNPDHAIETHLRTRYGMSIDEYDALSRKQDGACAICGTKDPGHIFGRKNKRMLVDHDHETGEVRGLLCHRCNVGIGNFGDDVQRMRNAIAYLESRKAARHAKA